MLQITLGQFLVLVTRRALLNDALFGQPVERLRQFAVTGFGHRLSVLFDSFAFFLRPGQSRILSADVRQPGNLRTRVPFDRAQCIRRLDGSVLAGVAG